MKIRIIFFSFIVMIIVASCEDPQKNMSKEDKEFLKTYLAEIDNPEIWQFGYYVNNFGNPTAQRYITNRELIKGTFKNTATQDSELNVRFLIDDSNNISIILYEYAGNNPVKSSSSNSYTIKVRGSHESANTPGFLTPRFLSSYEGDLKAINRSDRLRFNEIDSRKLHNILVRGGKIQFWIQDIDCPTTQYKFTIQNAEGYEDIYKELNQKLYIFPQ